MKRGRSAYRSRSRSTSRPRARLSQSQNSGTLSQYISNRKPSIFRAPVGNSVIIPRVVNYDLDFTVDVAKGFGFSPNFLWVNGVSTSAMGGATDISNLFDTVKVVKVEITILWGNDSMDYANNTVTTGTRNIPYVYDAFDPNDSTNPSLADIRQMASVQISMAAGKPLTRVIYPVLQEANGDIVEMGLNRRSRFVKSSADIPWNGWKVYMDLSTTALTYSIARAVFKVFYECKFAI